MGVEEVRLDNGGTGIAEVIHSPIEMGVLV
jgi:hypothetical protein